MKTAPINRPAIRILVVFLLVEAFLFTWAWGVRRLIPDQFPQGAEEMYKGVARETNPWLEPWQRWDTPQYQAIAERGYSAFDTAYFTPPVYPFLMSGLAFLFGGNTLASGLFISGLAFLGCLLVIHKLALLEFGNADLAMRTVIYLAVYPAAFFLVAAYNESIFMLTAMFSIYFTRKEKWLAAGLLAGLAALIRIPGLLLVLPLGYAAWQAWKKCSRKSWLALLVMGLGPLLYYIYQWIWLGKLPTSILIAQTQRGGYLTVPGLNIFEAVQRIINGQLVIENFLELLFTLIFIVFTVLIWKKLPRLYGLYAASLMLFFLARMGSPQPLISMVRYTMEIFPVFLLFATWGAKPIVHRLIFYLSWLGLLFFTAQFAIWGWVG
jgi:Gpi18-like mannosyltransferase